MAHNLSYGYIRESRNINQLIGMAHLKNEFFRKTMFQQWQLWSGTILKMAHLLIRTIVSLQKCVRSTKIQDHKMIKEEQEEQPQSLCIFCVM